jgi:S-adenosylmethionine-dependent methyltransferase
MDATSKGQDRFDKDAKRYADYLETPDGRLRADLTFAHLLDALPEAPDSLHVLDIGCGTGSASIRLARLGCYVVALDSSPAMLQLMEQTVIESGVRDKIDLKCGDASRLDESLASGQFDVVVCHNVLEYVDDPESVLRGVSRRLRNSASILSVLVRNQAGEVLKAALQTGDLVAAENNLETEWGTESLYGGSVRFFTPESMETMLRNASLTIVARRGVRVLSDYLPANISRAKEYQQIFALEQKLSERTEFFGMARYLHYIVSGETTEFESE